ncbi:uncharacterized protein RSE6_10325 [Rhynchosporium secalis]|uniref:Apple domain-containing protein n=1 Tax=Rhynchosporium secalis TaxID=38038 RepID=A0A1E1MK46_RHYSE|nr:uncharacterized protein RSE6_10325 [Rhynchosporium secalis]
MNSRTLIIAAFLTVGNAVRVPVLRASLARAGDTCGAVGVITDFDKFIEDRFDNQYTTVSSCALACAGVSGCHSFDVRIAGSRAPFCELHAGSQKQAGFVEGNNGTRTASMYQGFDMACFEFIEVGSAIPSSDVNLTASSSLSVESSSWATESSSGFETTSFRDPWNASESSSSQSSSSFSDLRPISVTSSPISTSNPGQATSSPSSSAVSGPAAPIFFELPPPRHRSSTFNHSPALENGSSTSLGNSSTPKNNSTFGNSSTGANTSGHKISLGPLHNNESTYKDESQVKNPELNNTQLGNLGNNSTSVNFSTLTTGSDEARSSGHKVSLGPLRNNMWTWKDNSQVKNPELNTTQAGDVSSPPSDNDMGSVSETSVLNSTSSPSSDPKSVTEHILSTITTHTTTTSTISNRSTITSTLSFSKTILTQPAITSMPSGYILQPIYEIFEIHVTNLDQCPPQSIDCKIGDAIEHHIEVGEVACPSDVQGDGGRVCYEIGSSTPELHGITIPIELGSGAGPVELESIAVPIELNSVAVPLSTPSPSREGEREREGGIHTIERRIDDLRPRLAMSDSASPLEARRFGAIYRSTGFRGSRKSSDGVSSQQIMRTWTLLGLIVVVGTFMWL